MIREIGHLTTLSAIVFSLHQGVNPPPENPLGSKIPDSPAKVFLAEGFRGVLPERIQIPGVRILGRHRLRNGHIPTGINPAILNKIDLLYPETR